MTVAPPVRYNPSYEQPQSDEAQTIDGFKDSFRSIMETTRKDYGHAVRGVHAKGHGIVTGTFTVLPGLPPELAQGLFASPGSYEAILRFSTSPGDILDDGVSSPRGVALKVLGVSGERLPESDDGDQDFVMVNGPVFGASTPAAFLKNLKLLAATTDKAEGLKKAWSATLRVLEGALEAVGGSSVLISSLGGAPETHPLGETYFSQTAYRYGDLIAKFSLAPVSPGLTERTGDKVDVAGRPDALREDVREVIVEQGGTWELRVQFCRDLEKMPVEDPTVLWDEKLSPFVTVATVEAAPQISWENGHSQRREDALSFSPWHGLAAHQPLGAINRVRREAYEFSANYRAEANGCPMHQVKQLEDLDD
ncbi:catalase family protein [Sphingomonas immobilis]|uniref:Catalase family protein n=1 Tax=Sphingomonas immobilis TaxID=3063997 RepID=A0ABT8ZWF5_9SPHN|nr:catalase family protein [Sphingomonas sp. CA1-15]MDO7841884.1 catalase family protein [Sphingomonas sp. CA1-15]